MPHLIWSDLTLRQYLPHTLPVSLPPVMQNSDIGPNTKMAHAHIEIILGLVKTTRFNARRDTQDPLAPTDDSQEQ